MTFSASTNGELVKLASRGSGAAFSVLVYRHGPQLLTNARQTSDPVGATTRTFVRAMRSLDNAPVNEVGDWLYELSGLPRAAADGEQPTESRVSRELDEIWRELAQRWPSGQRPRHIPSWAIWLATTIVLVTIAVGVPWAVLGRTNVDEPVEEELRASTLVEEEVDSGQQPAVEEPSEPLPSFEFPTAPEDSSPSNPPSSGTDESESANADEALDAEEEEEADDTDGLSPDDTDSDRTEDDPVDPDDTNDPDPDPDPTAEDPESVQPDSDEEADDPQDDEPDADEPGSQESASY